MSASRPELAATARKSTRPVLLVGVGVDSLGSGLSAGAVILYFATFVGFTPAEIAIAMSVGAGVGIATPVPIGVLADRLGLVPVYCAALLIRGTGILLYATIDTYLPFFFATILILGFESTTFPLQQSLIAASVPATERMRLVSLVRAVRNATMGIGAVLAGLALTTGSRELLIAIIIANGASFFVLAAAVLVVGRHLPRKFLHTSSPERISSVLRNPPFLALSGINSLVAIYDTVLFFLLPLWIVTQLLLSPLIPGVLIFIATVLTVLFQSFLASSKRLPSSKVALNVAAICLVISCLLAALTPIAGEPGRVVMCVIVVAFLTAGENLHGYASWDLAFQVSPKSRRSEYLSAFSAGTNLQGVVGPLLIASVLALGFAGWALLAFVMGGAALLFNLLSARMISTRLPENEHIIQEQEIR